MSNSDQNLRPQNTPEIPELRGRLDITSWSEVDVDRAVASTEEVTLTPVAEHASAIAASAFVVERPAQANQPSQPLTPVAAPTPEQAALAAVYAVYEDAA